MPWRASAATTGKTYLFSSPAWHTNERQRRSSSRRASSAPQLHAQYQLQDAALLLKSHHGSVAPLKYRSSFLTDHSSPADMPRQLVTEMLEPDAAIACIRMRLNLPEDAMHRMYECLRDADGCFLVALGPWPSHVWRAGGCLLPICFSTLPPLSRWVTLGKKSVTATSSQKFLIRGRGACQNDEINMPVPTSVMCPTLMMGCFSVRTLIPKPLLTKVLLPLV